MKTIYLKNWDDGDPDYLVLYRVTFDDGDYYFNGKPEIYDRVNGGWKLKDKVPDYTSGFGDSFLWDKITEEEAEAAIKAYRERHPLEKAD